MSQLYYYYLTQMKVDVGMLQLFFKYLLTFREPGWIIVDVAEGDVDSGGPGQPPQLAPHVLGLDQHLVLFLHLSVHIGQGCLYNTWQDK